MSSTLEINMISETILSLMGGNSISNVEHTTETYGDYEERAHLPFLEETTKMPPMSSIRTSFAFVENSSNATLSLTNAYQFISNCRLRLSYPSITVSRDYSNSIRIRAPHCLALSHIKSISIKIDSLTFSPISNIGWLFALQYCRPFTDTVESVKHGLGCIPRLENWSTYLHAFKSRIRLPFEIGGAIQPIKLFGAKEIIFDLKYESDISKIYLMESLIDNVWTPIPFDFGYVNCTERVVKAPELEMTISVPSKHLKDAILKEWNAQRIYYTSEILSSDVPNRYKINFEPTFDIKTKDKILSIGSAARSCTHSVCNDLNFTTQSDVYKGYSVINNMTLLIDSKPIISDSSDSLNLHCQDMEFSYPFENGFVMMTFGSSTRATEPGIRISDSAVQIKMNLSDGELIECGTSENDTPAFNKYKITIFYRILRKYTISREGDKFVHLPVN